MEDRIKKQIVEWDNLYKEQADFYHQAAAWAGMSDAAYWILYYVYWKEEELSQSDFCTENFFSKQTIHSAVAKLIVEGYVELIQSEGNRKRKIVSLTNSGEELCRQYVEPVIQIEQETFSEFTEEEIERMLSVMKRQIHRMKEKAKDIWQ